MKNLLMSKLFILINYKSDAMVVAVIAVAINKRFPALQGSRESYLIYRCRVEWKSEFDLGGADDVDVAVERIDDVASCLHV